MENVIDLNCSMTTSFDTFRIALLHLLCKEQPCSISHKILFLTVFEVLDSGTSVKCVG